MGHFFSWNVYNISALRSTARNRSNLDNVGQKTVRNSSEAAEETPKTIKCVPEMRCERFGEFFSSGVGLRTRLSHSVCAIVVKLRLYLRSGLKQMETVSFHGNHEDRHVANKEILEVRISQFNEEANKSYQNQ